MSGRKKFFDRFSARFESLDATSRQAGLALLMRERGFFETVANAVEDGILVVDAGLHLRYFNRAAKELLALPEPPTVVIVGRDYQASGIYQACIDNHLIPGKDLSIIGYGDFGWADGKTFLTTYREPVEALGAAAADIACDILQGKDRPKRREIHPELLMRQSLSPIIRSPFP